MPSPQCPRMPQHANGSLNIHIFDVCDVHSCTWAAAACRSVRTAKGNHIGTGHGSRCCVRRPLSADGSATKKPPIGSRHPVIPGSFGKTLFIQRPCGHCEATGTRNAWHFEFSCVNKLQAAKRARTYAGMADLPGTIESPSGLPTSYTFSGHAVDPRPEENPVSIDDTYCESGNGEWDQ
jgi:hypothetical protein